MARVAAGFDRGRYAYLPFDDPEAQRFLALLPADLRYESSHLVLSSGAMHSYHGRVYRLIARNRHRLGSLVPDGPGPRRYP